MLSERMKNLDPYKPGEQPNDREYIKLNANENPYPPSPKAAQAVSAFVKDKPQKLGLYPDPDSNELKAALAELLNKTGGVLSKNQAFEGGFKVTPDMIYMGNGSDEVLSFVFYAFFDSDKKLVRPEYSYSFYPVYCGFYGIPSDTVPLKGDWSVDIDEMIFRANKNHSSTIIANPNAPTSLGLSRDQIRAWMRRAPRDRVFVVDEAYVDFGGETVLPLLAEFKNLVVVRTFSKSLCGAGLRCGYIVANPELAQAVTTVKNSLNHFPLDAFTQKFALETCRDGDYYVQCAQKVVAERDSFIEFLRERSWNVLQSQTNFVFCKKNGVDGRSCYESLKKEGILVRRFDTKGIEQYLRITIGNAEQMNALKEAMKNF
ncbi:MAG: histidinol-phosphate transaminase [Treponema sp.]|nr:histidinol-phosphate transaminase [Treponema sp.]